MKKETLIIHTDTWSILKGLKDDQLGKLFTALMRYQREEDLPKMDNVTKMAFDFMAAQVDRDNEKYEQTIERRRAAGKAGASARWQTHKSHAINSHTDTDTVTDTDTDTDTERYVSLAPAALPSLSPDEEIKIHQEYPEDAERLIEEVRLYYTNHRDKPFPGWFEAVKTFSHNQRRWGKTSAPRGSLASMQEILDRVVPEE